MASILIVEDEMITALAMKQLVESWGHIVPAIVSNGAGAIRLARELDPDLILMDIFLANGVTGIDAARALEDRTRLRIVFVTASDDPKIRSEIDTFVSTGVVQKPYTTSDLLNAITTALTR